MRKPKILVCINNNEHSRVALKLACLKAQRKRLVIEILHIVESTDYQNFLSVVDIMRKERLEEGMNLLENAADLAYQITGKIPSMLLKEGVVGNEIIETIKEDNDIALVIIGTSYESGSSKKLIPYLTSCISDEIIVPMLIVPGNLTEQQISEIA